MEATEQNHLSPQIITQVCIMIGGLLFLSEHTVEEEEICSRLTASLAV